MYGAVTCNFHNTFNSVRDLYWKIWLSVQMFYFHPESIFHLELIITWTGMLQTLISVIGDVKYFDLCNVLALFSYAGTVQTYDLEPLCFVASSC